MSVQQFFNQTPFLQFDVQNQGDSEENETETENYYTEEQMEMMQNAEL